MEGDGEAIRPGGRRGTSSAARRRSVHLSWLIVAASLATYAQQPATPKTLWYSYNADHLVTGRWELHFDGSYRPVIGSHARQWMVRPGVNLALTDRLKLSLAYGYFDTHPNGLERDDGETREHRAHQQIEYSVPWRRTLVRQRFRMEERRLSSPWADGAANRWRWQDRPRYMLRWDLPLGKPGNGSKAPVLTVYDEVLFSVASQAASALEQNRVYSSLTWRLRPGISVETGLMHQAVKAPAGHFRHNVVILLMLRNSHPLRSLLSRLGGG